jgi:hypothetical protein
MSKTAKIGTIKRQPGQSARAAVASTVFSAGFLMSCIALCFLMLVRLTAVAQTTQKQDIWKQAGVDDNLRQAFERTVYALKDSGNGLWRGSNDAQNLSIEFDSQGARLKHPLGSVGFHLAGYGYGKALQTPTAPKLSIDGARLEYGRGNLTEWYVNGRQGLEQGFTLQHKPSGTTNGKPLTIALGVTGDLALSQQDGAILLKSGKSVVLRYAGLTAVDARGRKIPARMEARNGQIRITVEDQYAQYPLTVDPTWSQQAELTASDPGNLNAFGGSVSVSGTTAVIGAFEHTVAGGNFQTGAAYVFEQSGSTWTQKAELSASDGATYDQFGASVSVSGTTVVIGAPMHAVGGNSHAGAVYVFVQSGSTWIQQAELTASDGSVDNTFGASVSVSGTTAVIGALGHTFGSNNYAGAAYVFEQSGSTWTQQAELTASDGAAGDNFGTSVSVSGTTAVIGAPSHAVGANSNAGAAYVFEQSGSTWTQQAELTAGDGASGDNFANSVSVSGTTAVIGAPNHTVGSNVTAGAAYVFEQSGSTWIQQAKLTASDGAGGDNFGNSVSVSGTTAVIGAHNHTVGSNYGAGAAYLFEQSGSTWIQQAELTAKDGTEYVWFGTSVSVSGSMVLIGASGHDAAYVFAGPTATHFSFSSTLPILTAGVASSQGITVSALNAEDGIATDYNGTANLTSTDSNNQPASISPTTLTFTNGVATLSNLTLTAGGADNTVTATDPVYTYITGTSGDITVTKTTPPMTVTPSSTSITTVQSLTVTVAVSGTPTPTGSLTLSGGGYTSTAATLTSGSATFHLAAGSLAKGSDTLTASYAPDAASSATYNAATGSATINVTGTTAQTITFPAITGTQYALSNLALTATASSGLAVSYTSTTPAVCSVSGSTASLLIAGTCVLHAAQAGNSIYAAAPTVAQSFAVHLVAQKMTFPAITQTPFALTKITLVATATSGLPVTITSITPTVCTVSGFTASLLVPGTCVLHAAQAGNSDYSPAPTLAQDFTVVKAQQSITFPAITGTQYALSKVTLTATASSGLAVTYTSTTPTVCTVSGSTASLLAPGTCVLHANQAGNTLYAAASMVAQSFSVHLIAQTITFPAITGTQYAGSQLTLTATATSGLAVAYTSTTTTVCTVSGSTASLLTAGTCVLHAAQAGNSDYAAAPALAQSFAVKAAVN